MGALISFMGAYSSYFLGGRGATGGLIVSLQTLFFLLAFVLAPRYGLLVSRKRARTELKERMSLTDTLLMPFHFAFMNKCILDCVSYRRSRLAAIVPDDIIKGLALMGDSMSHTVFLGVIIAYMVSLPLAAGAFVAWLVCTITIGFLKNNSCIKRDTLMGIVFSGMFCVGLVMCIKVQSTLHLQYILFGDMLRIGTDDLIEAAVISAATVLFIAVTWKDLLQTFDAAQAKASNLNVRLLRYGLLCFLP